jgi:hypothetical protein
MASGPQGRPFKVNTKKARSAAAKAECADELGAFFACMMVRETGVGVVGVGCGARARRRRRRADPRPVLPRPLLLPVQQV